MKYLILLLLTGCIMDKPEIQENSIDPGEILTKTVIYKTSAHLSDVTYCREDGAVMAKYSGNGLTDTLEIPLGTNICLSIQKLQENNNISAMVSIYANGTLIYKNTGKMRASVSGTLK